MMNKRKIETTAPDLDDPDLCELCPNPIDERIDDLVMLYNGGIAHLACAIWNDRKWQE